MSHLDPIINAAGPKKLLSIDGGGIRGLVAVEFVARIEALLREHFRRPSLVLSQYFDYIGGTSTGAIVGGLISLGYSADEIRRFYRTGARRMFTANAFQRIARRTKGPISAMAGIIGQLIYRAMYDPVPLEREIKEVIHDPLAEDAPEAALTTFGTEKLRTLFLAVTRNASTDSPWPLSNNPRAKYNVRFGPDGHKQATNLDIPLWRIIRASTAAPVYFPAESFLVPGSTEPFTFTDGGLTVYNNPAFQLFLMATLPEYRLCWPASERDLLLISVGTGQYDGANLNLKPREMNLLYNAQSVPAALMLGAAVEQDLLCRIFGRIRPASNLPEIDSEVGALVGNHAPLSNKLFSYARYNVELSKRGLSDLGITDIDPKDVQPLDDLTHLDELERVGRAAAQRDVSIEDFEGFLEPSLLRPDKSL